MNKEQLLLKQKVKLEKYINSGVCPETDWGLCDNVLLEDFHYVFWEPVFVGWPEFSGFVIYPIEGGFNNYHNNRHKHDRRTEYGKLRLSLAKQDR